MEIKNKKITLFMSCLIIILAGYFLYNFPVKEKSNLDNCYAVTAPLISGWDIPVDVGFCKIQNEKSIQLNNNGEQKVIYLSTITVEREDGKLIDSNFEKELNGIGAPKLSREEDSYNLEGAKVKGDNVLIVVITFVDSSDEKWARDYFDRIK